MSGASCHVLATVDLDDGWQRRLGTWLDAHDSGANGEPVDARLLAGGTQNQVLAIRRGDRELVLRAPPRGASSQRTRALMREYRIQRALAETDVPHAAVRGLCEDTSVIGSVFFVMDYVEGWSPADEGGWAAPYDEDTSARYQVAIDMIDALVRLTRVDYATVGLADFGRPDSFHDRQVDRWLSHLAGFRFRDVPGLDVAAGWLRNHTPRAFVPGIMHGDYQFANTRFKPGGAPGVAAILDWEMATVGDPLLDLAWVLMLWRDPGEGDDSIVHVDYTGMPTRAQLLEYYARASGLDVDAINYYLTLAHFKMAIVLEGGYAAFKRGEAWSPRSETFGPVVLDLAARAARLCRSEPVL